MPKQHAHDHNHASIPQNIHFIFYVGIGLNLLFTLVEFVAGYFSHSLALLSDASHNLSDVASLIISLFGMKLAHKVATSSYTYGFKKASILASLINAVFLVIVVIGIIREAIERFSSPVEASGNTIMLVAGIGVLINTVSAFLFYKGQKSDINIKGAFLHLLVDALVSVAVVVSGLIIKLTGYTIVDPIISLIVGAVVLLTTWGLLKESLRLVIDAVPKEIDLKEIIGLVQKVELVENVHHVHVWAISSQVNALSAHIVITEKNVKEWNRIKTAIKHHLFHHNIQHVTLELEIDENCKEKNC